MTAMRSCAESSVVIHDFVPANCLRRLRATQIVFVWRREKVKGGRKEVSAAWDGPGVVQVDSSKNIVWVDMAGGLIRTSPEHVRMATDEELAIYQEMPYAEIGNVLDIPVGTVKSRMHNCVRALRAAMADAAGASKGATARGRASDGFRRLGGSAG